MTNEDDAEDFKKALLHQAYLDFLSFACSFAPMLKQFEEETGKKPNEDFEGYRVWVTETYWGDAE